MLLNLSTVTGELSANKTKIKTKTKQKLSPSLAHQDKKEQLL